MFQQVKDSIKYEDEAMLLLFTLEKDYIKFKVAGYDIGHPRKMFRNKFKYQQLPEKIKKHVDSVEALFELLRSRENFVAFKMAASSP